MLFRRLCEYELVAAKKKKEAEYLESRRKELVLATERATPKILLGPVQTIRSRTRPPHGEPLAACSVVRAVCDGPWEG